MVRQVFVYMIVLSIMSTLTSEGAPVAKPGCQSDCGNLSIPFPFGIGADCYLDEWYEIVCNKSTVSDHMPFLKLINLQVLNITLEEEDIYHYSNSYGHSYSYSHTSNSSYRYMKIIQVRNPITFWNCTGKKTHQPLNLTGSPFEFVRDYNTFIAVSCGQLASMTSSNLDGSGITAGCKSTCSTNHDNRSCDGVNCCQTNIPSNFQTFTTSIVPNPGTDHTDDTCKYAFLVDEDWFDPSYTDPSGFVNSTAFVAISDMDYVPVILYWNLYNYSENKILGNHETNNYGYSCSNTSTYSTNSVVTLTCSCNDGFEGNPYLPNGCQDINECLDFYHCETGTTCVNTIGSYECQRPKKPNIKIILIGFSSGNGALFLLIGAWGLYKFIKKRKDIKRKKKFFKRKFGQVLQQHISSGEVHVDSKTKLFSSKELRKATDNFNVDRILGQGGQGTVYKGMLADGKIVAVKRSKMVDEGNIAEFINEVVILSQINHRNVVRVLGCCLDTEVPILVYEFIPNGTLFEYIHNQSEDFLFTWEMCLRIATEIAGALFYLHSAASFPIYHRDIKSSNILLDDKYRAKVADFGTSRSIAIEQTHVTTLVHGTFGYLDPEYFQSSQFTEKSDVYSFGVVIAELLTGQKPICSTRLEEGRSLATYFLIYMEENRFFDIVDARIVKDEEGNEEIVAVANLAKRCLNLNGKFRPTMKEVATELEAIQKSGKTCSTQENYNQVELLGREVTEPWEVPASIGSNSTSSFDVSPLLSFN